MKPMKPLELNAITDFILACEVFFLAGRFFEVPKVVFSPAWWWNVAIIVLGTSTLIGGIDHGFFDIPNRDSGIYITKLNWSLLGLTTFAILMMISKQFFSDKVQRIALGIGVVQLIVYIYLVIVNEAFLVVIINNLPVFMLLLAINIVKYPTGLGSWEMIVGVLILIAASLVQSLGVDIFSPLDRNGLGHLILMVGVLFLFKGGIKLDTGY